MLIGLLKKYSIICQDKKVKVAVNNLIIITVVLAFNLIILLLHLTLLYQKIKK
jgi:hypothetical protein